MQSPPQSCEQRRGRNTTTRSLQRRSGLLDCRRTQTFGRRWAGSSGRTWATLNREAKGSAQNDAGPLGHLFGTAGGGAPTASEQKFQQFANTVQDLHTREAFAKFQQWRNENGGAEVPVDVQSTLLQQAAKEVRKSDEYKAAKNAALGLDENGVAPPKPRPVNKDPKQGPVPELAAPSIGRAEAKQYKDKAVMNPGWVHRELKSLQTGNGTSADLFRVSRTAGVLPERYLMEQLKFYPDLDPSGGIRAFLQGVIDGKKAGSTPATTYGDQSSTPRSPTGAG